ncbi:methionine ABC transporter permease [Lactovum miscens]|uniref:D-methionine transport system permease protein n=1 Tax=Lactovum miscens TaxID=190387 RepID=A0A841C021_9LACT|nr:methionine ABC transporter permease [Lactovum miscens]MBB5887236.1 D-methionine transport system permease protein [Lactovum miscens]
MNKFFPNVGQYWPDFGQATIDTLLMTILTMVISGMFGIIIGLILLSTNENGLTPNRIVYIILDKIVDIGRAIPFIILLVAIIPFTRLLVGTSIGTAAVTVPIVVGTIPFFARMVQNSLMEVDPGVVEAAKAMGTSNLGIIFRVYLKEGLIPILRDLNFTTISVVGLTAMAGIVGGGGLGNMAVQYGYQRGANDVTFVSLIFVLIIVFISQMIGNAVIKLVLHGRKV